MKIRELAVVGCKRIRAFMAVDPQFSHQALKHLGRFWVGCCLLLLLGCRAEPLPQGMVVKVNQVLSGQSLEVVGTGGQEPQLIERVRLIGIEVPGLEQRPWGSDARKWLQQAIGEKPVLLESDVEEQDRFQRRLAYVWQEGQLLNEQLVAEGHALAVSRSPNTKYDQRLARAQERARLMGLGIWNPDNPMRLTPTEFRSQN